jgi:hypothetical protein
MGQEIKLSLIASQWMFPRITFLFDAYKHVRNATPELADDMTDIDL